MRIGLTVLFVPCYIQYDTEKEDNNLPINFEFEVL
jgi:hypothetical protein